MTLTTSDTGYEVVIGIDPVPAARPRVSKWGTYYPETYKKWKAAATKFFPKLFEQLKGPLGVELEVICKKPQRPTKTFPRGDVDNYAKAALDAVNDAQLWGDDDQVQRLIVSKRYAEKDEQPRTIIKIWRL